MFVLTIATSVLAGGCSSSGSEPEITGSSAPLPADDTAHLLVLDPAARDRLDVVTMDGVAVASVDLAAACPEPCAPRSVVDQPAADRHYVITDVGVVEVDPRTGQTRFIEGEEIRFGRPDARYAVGRIGADQLTVVDTSTSATESISITTPVAAVLDAGPRVIIATAGPPAQIVDVNAGQVDVLDRQIVLAREPLDASGTMLLGTGVADRRAELLVIDVADPARTARWHTAESGLAAAWVGDDVLVVEPLDGRVSVVDEGAADELARLEPGSLGSPRIFSNPDDQLALVRFMTESDVRWYRVDAAAGTVDPLPDLDGLDISRVRADRDVLLLDDHGDSSELTRLVAVAVGEGAIADIIASDEPATYFGDTAGPGRMYLRRFGPVEKAWVVDLATGERTATAVGSNPTVSPDGATLALTTGRGLDGRVTIVPVNDPANHRTIGDGFAIGWVGL